MDLFELLFIAAFILFPILEGVLRQRKKKQGPPVGRDSRDAGETSPGEARSAADMLPDDLWELMTGENRQRPEPSARGEGESPWSTTPETLSKGTAEPETGAESFEGWEPEPWMDAEETVTEPTSLEYRGPEAYSLETPAPPPQSLEQPIPSPEARHRAFHELIDRPPARKVRVATPLMRALRRPEGLRQAVLLREVLGPPKGLE